MRDQETCGRCPFFVLEGMGIDGEHGLVIARGTCAIDGESVRADNPTCSSAPSGHPATPCGEIGGDDGTTYAD